MLPSLYQTLRIKWQPNLIALILLFSIINNGCHTKTNIVSPDNKQAGQITVDNDTIYNYLSLDTVIESITPIDLSSDNRFGSVNFVYQLNNNGFVVGDLKQNKIIYYDEDGNFKREITNVCKGKKFKIGFDPYHENILSFNINNGFFVYDSIGTLIFEGKNPCEASLVATTRDGKSIFYKNFNPFSKETDDYFLYFGNSHFQLSNARAFPYAVIPGKEMPVTRQLSYSNDRLLFFKPYNDTVYEIHSSRHISTAYILHYTKNKFDTLSNRDSPSSHPLLNSFIGIDNNTALLEYSQYLVRHYVLFYKGKSTVAYNLRIERLQHNISTFGVQLSKKTLLTFITREELKQILQQYERGFLHKDHFYDEAKKIELDNNLNDVLLKIQLKHA
jgi:hypothetical protein